MADPATLLLLTNRYPFGTGEEYLAQELPHLAANFERVIILPCMAPNSDIVRQLPAGVEVVRPRHPDHRRGLPGMMARGLKATKPTAHPVRMAYDSYLAGRASAILDTAREPLLAVLGGASPAVIYSYWFYVSALVGAQLRDEMGWDSTLVSRAHGYDVNVQASPVKYLPARELLLSSYDRVHPVSDTATTYLQETYPSYAAKVSTRRLGTARPLRQARSCQAPITLITCSMIRPLKRLHLVGEAVEQLRSAGHDVRWAHFGTGSGRYAKKLLSTFGNKSHISFRGYVPNEQIFEAYADLQATAFLNVSISEGVPVSVMEAMACGIPTLATDVGGTAELLGPLSAASLLPADLSSDGLAAAILARILCLPLTEYGKLCADMLQRWEDTASAETLYSAFARELRQN